MPDPMLTVEPLSDTLDADTALVVLPFSNAFAVNVVAPVPPLPTGSVPVTLVVRLQ